MSKSIFIKGLRMNIGYFAFFWTEPSLNEFRLIGYNSQKCCALHTKSFPLSNELNMDILRAKGQEVEMTAEN